MTASHHQRGDEAIGSGVAQYSDEAIRGDELADEPEIVRQPIVTGETVEMGGSDVMGEPAGTGETLGHVWEAVHKRRKRASGRLVRAGQTNKAYYDKRRKVATEYKMGELVLWKGGATCSNEKGVNRKLIQRYSGPYRVSKVMENDRYKIASVKGARGYKNFEATAAVDSLRRYMGVMQRDKLLNGDSSEDELGEVTDRQDLIDLLEG